MRKCGRTRLSPFLPANVYPVLAKVPPDDIHDGFVVRPCGVQPDVLEAAVYVPQGNPVAATEQEPGSDDDDDRGRNGRDRRDNFTHGDLHKRSYRGPETNVKLSAHLHLLGGRRTRGPARDSRASCTDSGSSGS